MRSYRYCCIDALHGRIEKKLDGNYTKMLRAKLNKSLRQHPTKQQLYGHLPPITKTIKLRRTRHAGHCWRSKDALIRDVLLWTSSYWQAKAGRPVGTYIQQLCADTGCSPEDMPEAMDDREGWRERVRVIRTDGATWWWWWWWWYSVLGASTTIDITVTFMFHSFFCKMHVFLHFFVFFSFYGRKKSTRWQVLFFLLINTKSDLLCEININDDFLWQLSDNQSSKLIRTFLSVLVDLKSAVVWMISIFSLVGWA